MVGFGTALAGYGGAVPQIQQMQQLQQQKQQEAAMQHALAQYMAQHGQQSAGAPQGMPGSQLPPQMMGPPQPGQGGPMQGPPQPSTQAPSGMQPQGGAMNGLPDPGTMLDLLSKSGLPPDQQYKAFQQYQKDINPLEKYQQQLELTTNKLDAAATRAKDQRDFLMQLQGKKGDVVTTGQDKRDTEQQRKDDLANLETEVKAARAHADAFLGALGGKALSNPEYLQAKKEYEDASAALKAFRKGGTPAPAAKTAPALADDTVAAPADIPKEAVNALKAAPDTAAQFDEIFGAGAAKKALGQ